MFQPIKRKHFYMAPSTSSTTTLEEDNGNHGKGPDNEKTQRDGALNPIPSNFNQRAQASSDPESYTN